MSHHGLGSIGQAVGGAISHAGQVVADGAGHVAQAASTALQQLSDTNKKVLLDAAAPLAAAYQAANPSGDYDNCVIITAAGVAAEAAALSEEDPAIAAALGAGGGTAAAQIACRHLFPGS